MRVSESTEELEEELNRVLWGFELGGLIVIILSGLGGLVANKTIFTAN